MADTALVRLPVRCGVIGGGRMGAGIAHAFLMAGAHVTIVERDVELKSTAERVVRTIDETVRRSKTDDAGELRSRVSVVDAMSALRDCGLIVEAVPEEISVKLEVLRAVEDVAPASAVIASNTSSLSVSLLGQALGRPERFLGLHFFNPVPVSRLVEIVVGTTTDEELPAVASGWVREMGKTPIVVRDSPGFASSRLGVALGLEAIRMVEDGVATAEDIDTAMTLGYAHSVGPLRLTDIVGLDVRLGIAHYLEREVGPRFTPPRLLVEMVANGDLGRKSGRGFYDWSGS